MRLDLINTVLILMIFQCAAFCTFLFIRRHQKRANIYLALFFLSQAVACFSYFIKYNGFFFFSSYPYLFFIGESFYFLAMPSIYLYLKEIAFSNSASGRTGILHFAPFVLVSLFFVVTFHIHSFEYKQSMLQSGFLGRSPLFGKVYTLLLFGQIGSYIVAGLFVIRKYRALIKNEYSTIDKINLSWLNLVLYGFFCAWITSIGSLFINTGPGNPSTAWSIINLLAFLIFFIIVFYRGLIQPELFGGIEEKPRYSSSKLDRSDADNYAAQLAAHMEREKPHLNPNVSLRDVSSQLSIPPRFLSQVINEYYHKSFFDFINQHRIEEAKKLIRNPSNANKKMIAILWDAGFNSKSSFNAAFKKNVGMTPSEFRDRA
jgi:AraC-like DNA-binding protein